MGYLMHQLRYAKGFKTLNASPSFEEYRSLLHKLAWLGHTRPYILGPINILSQVTENTFETKHVKLIDTVVGRAKEMKEED